MKHNLYNQFSPIERAQLLLDKYPEKYVISFVTSEIEKARDAHEIPDLNYWVEVSLEIKSIIKL